MSDVEPVWAFSEILRHIERMTQTVGQGLAKLDRIEENQRNMSNALIAVQAELRHVASTTDLRRVEGAISMLGSHIHGMGVDVSQLQLLLKDRPKEPPQK